MARLTPAPPASQHLATRFCRWLMRRMLGTEPRPYGIYANALRAIPGVAAVEPFRSRRITVQGRPAFRQGIAVTERLARGGLAMVDGTLDAAASALRAGHGVLLSGGLAFFLGLHRGENVTLATPSGPRVFRVEGTYTDYLGAMDLGAVAVDYAQLGEIWGDHSVNMLRVWVAPEGSPAGVRAAILARLGATHGYFVLTAGDFLNGIRSLLQGFFRATWAMQLVAALVGVIGVVNAQLATVLDRGTEITTLRTIGISLRDITRSTLMECGILGLLGGVVGIGLGTMLAAEMVTVALRLVTGLQMPFAVAPGPLLGGIAAAAALSAFAGWVPAQAAGHIEARRLPAE
jgi:putative ABC transport system permease protein